MDKCGKILYEYVIEIDNHIKTDKVFIERYTIIKPIYIKKYKAAYIIKSNKDNNTNFLKVKINKYVCNDEIKICNLLQENESEYVIGMKEIIDTDKLSYFIYEYYESENLLEYMNKLKTNINSDDMKSIIIQISKSLKHIHNLKIIHCDIKLENILINKDKKIKLIDFDLARLCSEKLYMSKNIIGTCNYISPESNDVNIYSVNSDIWSFGILIYFLIMKQFPYIPNIHCISHLLLTNKYKHMDFDSLADKKDIYGNIIDLVKKMLSYRDTDRSDINEIISTVSN